MSNHALPCIVRFLGTEDHGLRGICPHCGQRGRYLARFQVASGRELQARRSCATLFPMPPLAQHHQYFIAKQQRLAARQRRLRKQDAADPRLIEEAIEGRATSRQALTLAASVRQTANLRHRQ